MISTTGMPILNSSLVRAFICNSLFSQNLPSRPQGASTVIPRQRNPFNNRYKTKEQKTQESGDQDRGKDQDDCMRIRRGLHIDTQPLVCPYILTKNRSCHA